MTKKKFHIPAYIYFVLAAILLVALFPRDGKFRYSFTEGKPWQYGLLTARFEFPIYKTADDLKAEQDSVMRNFAPYFTREEQSVTTLLSPFDGPWEYKRYLENALTTIYSSGVVSVTDYQFLSENSYAVFKVLENREAVPHSTKDIFTVRSAYTYLVDNLPANLNSDVLRSFDLSRFLKENLYYDEQTSEKAKRDDLQKISPSSGMVQAGEKIIDNGEIVTPKIYQILSSLKQITEAQAETNTHTVGLMIGISLIILSLMACLLFYFYFLRRNIWDSSKDIIFILLMTTLFIVMTELSVAYGLFSYYMIPYVMLPIVLRTFFDSRTAQMCHWTVILVCALMVSRPLEFILLQFIVGSMAIYILKDLTRRKQLIECSFYILLAYVFLYFGYTLMQEGDLTQINWYVLIYFVINFLFVMFTYPFIYILEKAFGYISNVTLVELSDINTPALTLLSEKTPGTFQHSLQVSMLGTAAATKVGANPHLVRTGALYHDLGKLDNPAYYTENKLEGTNPHADKTLEESARIITSHVPNGVRRAADFGLPQAIVQFIRTHHGKGKAKYFYNTYKNEHPNEPVDEAAFSYEGENPNTKETAILMMADSVEAASRSLRDYTEESIRGLVNKIIDGQIADGLLEDAPLTFKNITDIKSVFIDKLMSMYHSRISYPDLKKPEEENPTEEEESATEGETSESTETN